MNAGHVLDACYPTRTDATRSSLMRLERVVLWGCGSLPKGESNSKHLNAFKQTSRTDACRISAPLAKHIRQKVSEVKYSPSLKAALINVFILTMNQITRCDVNGVAQSADPAENDHFINIINISAAFMEHFSIFELFVLTFSSATLLFFCENVLINRHIHYLTSTKQQADKVSDYLVNTAEYLAAKEPRGLAEMNRAKGSEWILDLYSSGDQKHDSMCTGCAPSSSGQINLLLQNQVKVM